MWDLNESSGINAFEDGKKKGNMFDRKLDVGTAGNIDAVSHIVWVLNEQEYAGCEEFLSSSSKNERQGEQGSTSGC